MLCDTLFRKKTCTLRSFARRSKNYVLNKHCICIILYSIDVNENRNNNSKIKSEKSIAIVVGLNNKNAGTQRTVSFGPEFVL